MKIITVYSIDNCPYCERAKSLLEERGVPFEEVRLDRADEKARGELERRSGMKTFPQIFHEDNLIGGYSDLTALDEGDRLAGLRARGV